ncbi:uncharacterized protein LOC124185820 [Neodiprion fabricii]|uniref:uncharacterized protein LOC124185820 n=1 Tax=Neodiprion fabricii TaxID=2872261 RepID=UPI001ED94961|nr:uncharacterized protein LOC124185820 [Neodiprion fabricii]
MGTMLAYSAALLFAAAIAAASNDAVASTGSPTASVASSVDVAEATGPKLKRGIVQIGTKSWASQNSYPSKSVNPSTSPTAASPIGGQYIQQGSSPESTAAYSPAKIYDQKITYNNQNAGAQQASPYTSQSYTAAKENYNGNAGQGYGNVGYSAPQNHGIPNQAENSGYTAVFTPQIQPVAAQNAPNFGRFQNAQPLTGLSQAQNAQSGQIQSAGIFNTPYYTIFTTGASPVENQQNAGFLQAPFEQQGAQKSQVTYAPNHQTVSYIDPSLFSYPTQEATSYTQASPYFLQPSPALAASSQVQQNAPKTNIPEQRSSDFSQMYAPYHQSASNFIPAVQQSASLGPVTVDFEGKKIPLPLLQLQSAKDFPGFAQVIHSQPIALETASPAQAQTEFNFLADFTKSLTPNLLPFLNNQQPSQPQVIPVKSANGSPQFPQYKGASINTGLGYNQERPAAGNYQHIKSQPQLQFGGKPALPVVPAAPAAPAVPVIRPLSSVVHHPSVSGRPLGENRDDVEIIKKKKPPAPDPHDFDEDEVDEGYRAIEREYGPQHDDVEDESPHRGSYVKESSAESDFKPSTGYPFESYEDKFGRYSKPSSDEEAEDDGPSSRYHHHSSADDDDDYDGHSTTHHANYRSPQSRPSRYEYPGEESRKNERQEQAEEEGELAAFNSYGQDFEQEFEDSYKRELPQSKYVHVKEVPEIEGTEPVTKYNSKSKESRHQAHEEEPEESRNYGSHSSQKYRKGPKNGDSEGYGSNVRSYNRSPKVIHEDSFGYKSPKSQEYSKYKKSPTGDSYSAVKKSPKKESYVKSSRSSYKSPENDNGYEKGDSYSYSTGSAWKSDNKKAPESRDYHGHASTAVKTLAQPDSSFSFDAFAIDPRSTKIVHDLTGI